MELPNPASANPLDVAERATAAAALRMIAEMFSADPVDESIDMPAEEQRERAGAIVADATLVADALSSEVVTFEQASTAARLLEVAEDVPMGPDERRRLLGAAAKLHTLVDRGVDERGAAYRAHMQRLVDERGFAIQHVLAQGEPLAMPAHSYTVGLRDLGHPELATVALPPPVAELVLGDIARRVCAGATLMPGDVLDDVLAGGMRLRADEATPAHRRELHAARIGEDVPAALRITWADPAGILPGEPGCDPAYAAAQDVPDASGAADA